ncbi:formate dehydrogenase subunit gamma [Oceanospirillum beijerinckii]|uniref:formate dehydrogenase subunit gamma n=1 Tax=Oceanospirillum beijerinckii TaxID=64976 RepID=UPI0003FF7AA4|nr:formate dehydrogenase subunit gamma [Oceanospirillum beijerinckii]
MSSYSQWNLQAVQEIIQSLKDKPGALLPILHAIQKAEGYIPPESVPLIADALQQSRAEIHGVISFYHYFRQTPPGRNQVQICRAEACQARGSRELEQHAKEKLGVNYHGTTADREFSLDAVYCLGNCACGPSVRIGDEVFGRVDAERFDELVDEFAASTVALSDIAKEVK